MDQKRRSKSDDELMKARLEVRMHDEDREVCDVASELSGAAKTSQWARAILIRHAQEAISEAEYKWPKRLAEIRDKIRWRREERRRGK